ncbi:restriction endonuclease subunit S [Haemophilus haemolyticus]|uniref:restriction endonuclease subunit S n=1 Tax=Haemophilus haemolyticus TaxID=726 RepID=UPI000802CA33|nr:restriction endonuclease subunit S [Haemophilus haemolyticus]OBX88869.1 type I restriction endonuclease [Haemophilus haemolyticus]
MKNNRTFLEKLLDGAEVEWKLLGKVTDIKTGQSVSKNIIVQNPGIYPVINSGREPLGFINVWNTENDPIGITTRGAGVGSITWQEGKYFRGNLNYSVTIKSEYELNVRFLYHILLHFQKEIHNLCSFTGIPALNASELKKLEIPIPPLPVQTEIVRILDALTALTSELTSELTLRRKQYEYYREKLLSEEELIKLGATAENLGDVTSISSGGTPSTKEPAYWVGGNIPWIKSESCKNKLIDEIKHHITEVGLQNSNAKLLSPNTTLMAMVGATIFKTAFLPFEATTNQNIAAIKSKNGLSITDKFIFYYLTNMYDFFISKLSGYNMVNLSQIKNIKILLPPLEEQQRIVAILDKFEALTNSITEGLPLAIEQSQKRYEYYRELLLNFS